MKSMSFSTPWPASGSRGWGSSTGDFATPKPHQANFLSYSIQEGTTFCGAQPEQIIGKLREAEVLLSQEQTVPGACKQIEVSEQRCGMSY
jgi:hypothetical protein